MVDLVVRGGMLVDAGQTRPADLAVDAGRIVAIERDVAIGAIEIDARGLLVAPGLIDVHVHFNAPGHEAWEGAATGSRALAAGGGTLFIDMPLNSTPCTVTARDFDLKHAALAVSSITDFALWGGLVPGHLADMDDLADRGVVGFKAFMCYSGLPEFPRADDATLLDGMRAAARLGLPVAVHAESHALTEPGRLPPTGSSVRDFLTSRPVEAEVHAIERAVVIAAETGAMLHLVHVSSGRGVAAAAEGRARGVDVSIETCPHYLCFTEDDVERLGAIAKCAPPLRHRDERDALWSHLVHGEVDIIASDHSPTEPARKAGDFRTAWGGIAGVQVTLSALLEHGHRRRGLALERIIELVCEAPARRFCLSNKGTLSVGADADLMLIDPGHTIELSAEHLQQRHKTSPYVGHTFHGAARRTIRAGETIFVDGRVTARTCGRLVRPRR